MKQMNEHSDETNKEVRKVYLVKETGGKLTLMMVKPDQEAAFNEEYGGRVIAAGTSIQEVIIKFSLLMNQEPGT
jgi:hypothetical protein